MLGQAAERAADRQRTRRARRQLCALYHFGHRSKRPLCARSDDSLGFFFAQSFDQSHSEPDRSVALCVAFERALMLAHGDVHRQDLHLLALRLLQ
jgi:hypothetical protein